MFREMVGACYEYAPAMQARSSPFLVESIFMSLVFAQHRTIEKLRQEIEELRSELE